MTNKFPHTGHFFQKIRIVSYRGCKKIIDGQNPHNLWRHHIVINMPWKHGVHRENNPFLCFRGNCIKGGNQRQPKWLKTGDVNIFHHFVPNISGSNLHIAFRPLPLRPEKEAPPAVAEGLPQAQPTPRRGATNPQGSLDEKVFANRKSFFKRGLCSWWPSPREGRDGLNRELKIKNDKPYYGKRW